MTNSANQVRTVKNQLALTQRCVKSAFGHKGKNVILTCTSSKLTLDQTKGCHRTSLALLPLLVLNKF